MSGPLMIGQLLQEALDSNSMQLMSSDGNEGSLESNQLVAELQEQDLQVKVSTPDTVCAAFNAGVCDIKTPDLATGPEAPKPAYDNNAEFGFA